MTRHGDGFVEEKVEKSPDREELVLEQSVIYEVNLEGIIVSWSPGAETLYGWKKSDAEGKPANEIFRAEFHLKLYDLITETLKEYIWTGELYQYRQDGVKITVSSHAILHRDEDGRPKGIIFVNRDITAIKEKVESLKASEEMVSVTINSMGDGVLATDTQGRVTLLNSVAENLTGWSLAEATGQPVENIFHVLNHDTRVAADIPVAEALSGGAVKSMENHTVLISRAGEECDIADSCAPILDRDGKIAGAVIVFRDITARVQKDYLLEKSRKELEEIGKKELESLQFAENLINTIRRPLLALDQELRIVTANRYFYDFFSTDSSQTMGKYIYNLGTGQWDVPGLREKLHETCVNNSFFEGYELEKEFENIGKRVMLLDARQIQRAFGEKPIVLLFMDDVTRLRETELGLEKISRELETTRISESSALEYSQSMINTVREPLIALDQDLRILTASRSFYEFFKVTPDETIGKLIFDLGNKQWDIPKLRSLLETILPLKTTFDNYEVIHDFNSIGRRVMLLNARQIQRTQGKEKVILLSFEDITARINSEEILAKFNRTLRAISNTNQALMHEKNEQNYLDKVCAIIVNDCAARFTWIGFAGNPVTKTIVPVSKCGVSDEFFKRLSPEWGHTKNGNYPAGRAIRTGKTVVCNNTMTDASYEPWREQAMFYRYSSVIALPLKSMHSVFGALMLYSAETDAFPESEIKILEELAYDLSYGIMLIKVRNEKIDAEFEIKKVAAFPRLNPNPISEIDSTGRIYYVNPAFKKAFPDSGKYTLSHPWFAGLSSYFHQLKGSRKKIIKRDIKVGDKHFLQTLVFMPTEGTIRTYGIDITKRMIAEYELKRLNEEMESLVLQRTSEMLASKHLADIGTLAATVAHELRNPLGIINLASYNLRKKTKSKDMLKHLTNIEKKVTESDQIINNLLVYSEMKMPQFEKTSVFNVVSECVLNAKKHFGSRKVSLKVFMKPIKDLFTGADPLQIKEVFTNIITNAYQAIDAKKGLVEVKAKLLAKKVISITVKDSGTGISKEDMGNMFKPFFTRKTKGTGLGLVICKDLVGMHGGTIHIKSSPGKGSVFTVTLPFRPYNEPQTHINYK